MMNIIHASNSHTKRVKKKKSRVNWHEAATCAIQIDLRDYKHMLDFQSEYILGKNNYRIDLLVIRKLSKQPIPKKIANIFRTYNLFEIKGSGSCVGTDSYYKTVGYAGLLINQTGAKNQYTSLDISLTFLSLHYPRKLFHHLQKERKLVVEKYAPGIYYINKEIFDTQIIVTKELLPDENLYLRCLTDTLTERELVNRLANDCEQYQGQELYTRYLDQIMKANTKKKGETAMVCEGLLNYFGTSSEEIIERTKKEQEEFYLPKIENLTSQVAYLQDLLTQNNIAFNLDSK